MHIKNITVNTMASHNGQKWSRFFYSSRDFLLKLTLFFQVEGFNSSRDIFYLSPDVSIQVEIFFVQVEMFQFKSKSFLFKLRCFNSSRDFFFQVENFFFHFEIFTSSRDFYLMSTVFSYRHFSFKEENFFLSQVEIFVLF